MATHKIPILGVMSLPASGNAFFEPFQRKGTTNRWKHMIATFLNSNSRAEMFGTFMVPKNYVGTAKIIVEWSSTVTTGDVYWGFEYRRVRGDNTESIDQASQNESVAGIDSPPTVAYRRMVIAITLTSANLAADDLVQFVFFRDSSNASDVHAAAVFVTGLYFEFSDV